MENRGKRTGSQAITPVWSIALIGGIRVTRPSGEDVTLPTRKVAGVLAVLAVANGQAISRSMLQEILWPDTPSAQQTQNLRSALAALRRVLGEDLPVEITRTNCRLRMESVQTDYPPVAASDHARLALEMDEPWFARLREGKAHESELNLRDDSAETPESSFIKVLEWAASGDPFQAVELMRSVPTLTASLPGAVLGSIGERLWPQIPSSHRLFGWMLHFRGVAQYLKGDVRTGLDSLAVAADFARNTKDPDLLGETVRWRAAPRIAVGDTFGAIREIERSLAMTEGLRAQDASILLHHARGIAYHHVGRYAEADASMLMALDGGHYRRDTASRAHLLANISLFRAARGDAIGAKAMVEEATGLAGLRPSPRVVAACRLSSALLFLRQHATDEAAKEFDALFAPGGPGAVRNFTTIDIYALESSATMWIQRKDLGAARAQIREAMKARQAAQMGVTPWDRARLEPAIEAIRNGKKGA